MGIQFSTTPELFGVFHICALIIGIAFNAGVFFYSKDKDETVLLNTIHIIGIFVFVMEIVKQIFCYIYVFDSTINLWFFPWQLCSMMIYCSLFIKANNKQLQNTLLIFLSTFNLFASIVALLTPLDMLRPQIFLTLYSFLYHFLMISVAILSIFILKNRDNLHFSYTIVLFIIMALVAEIINVISHHILHDIHREPDMFYITPYYPTTQPVFHTIAIRYGIFTEVIIYLGSIILFSYLIYRLIQKLFSII